MKQKNNARNIGLGSGLSSLLGTDADKNSENYKMVPIELIRPGPWQPRKIFDKKELESLSISINEYLRSLEKAIALLHGIVQGVVVQIMTLTFSKKFSTGNFT